MFLNGKIRRKIWSVNKSVRDEEKLVGGGGEEDIGQTSKTYSIVRNGIKEIRNKSMETTLNPIREYIQEDLSRWKECNKTDLK